MRKRNNKRHFQAFGIRFTCDHHLPPWDTVLLAGLMTSGCVRATCVDSMSHGFITAVVRDSCGDRHAAPHEANMFNMKAEYADVVLGEEALAY